MSRWRRDVWYVVLQLLCTAMWISLLLTRGEHSPVMFTCRCGDVMLIVCGHRRVAKMGGLGCDGEESTCKGTLNMNVVRVFKLFMDTCTCSNQ